MQLAWLWRQLRRDRETSIKCEILFRKCSTEARTNRFYCRCRACGGEGALNSDTFIVCQKIYPASMRNAFSLLLLLAWRLGETKPIADCDGDAQGSRQQANEEDSIIDNFLTLFHKLCAFKCLTRKINKRKVPSVSHDRCLAFGCAQMLRACEAKTDHWDGSRNGLFYLAMTNYRKQQSNKALDDCVLPQCVLFVCVRQFMTFLVRMSFLHSVKRTRAMSDVDPALRVR